MDSLLSKLFLLTVFAALFVACTSSEPFEGKYREVFLADQATFEEDTALELDLFQFGDEVGGIVRYYSTLEAERFGLNPYQTEARRCFWTEPVRIAEGQTSFQLRYRDEFGSEVVLRIQSDAAANTLDGRLSLFTSNSRQDASLVDLGISRSSEGRDDVQLVRLTARNPDNFCDANINTGRDFTIGVRVESTLWEQAQDELDGSICNCSPGTYCDTKRGTCSPSDICDIRASICEQSDELCDPILEACVPDVLPGVLTAGLFWANASDSSPDRNDWISRVSTFTRSTGTLTWEKTIPRTLAPSRWDEPPIPLLDAGEGVSVGLGVLLVYREESAVLPNGEIDLRNQQWDSSNEPVFGIPFRLVSRGNQQVFQGPVVLYIEGDIAQLSDTFLSYFPNDPLRQPRVGYGLYDIEFDADFSSVISLSYRDAAQTGRWIDLFPRSLDIAFDELDPARRLPRLNLLSPAR